VHQLDSSIQDSARSFQVSANDVYIDNVFHRISSFFLYASDGQSFSEYAGSPHSVRGHRQAIKWLRLTHKYSS